MLLLPTGFVEEEAELSDQDAGVSTEEPNQQLSEQNYRKTVRGLKL